MNNVLSYYYNINSMEIHQYNDIYKIYANNALYIFYLYNRDTNDIKLLYDLHLNLLSFGYYCHNIELNRDKEVITEVNGKDYVLLKVLADDRKISLNDVISFSKIYMNFNNYSRLVKNNWYLMWSQKIDYIEYQSSQFADRYPLIRESIPYFIGVGENCISLLHDFNTKDCFYSISHFRINSRSNLIDLYNPLEFIIDFRVRDACEYFKSQFFTGNNIDFVVNEYLIKNNLNKSELYLFFVRMLFPSFYFDMYEKILNGECDEEKINTIINLISNYELFISNLYLEFREKIDLPLIEWIIKT